MKNPLRVARFACALIGLASFAAVGPAEGAFDLNHYILRCGDYCPSIQHPVVFGGSIDATFTGSWYDPDQNGQGLFVEILPDHRVTAYWFTFDPAGMQQAWFAGAGIYTGNVATFASVAMPTGGRWIPDFEAAKVVDKAWGTMTLTFDGYDRGKVEFKSVLGYGTGSMNLQRLTQPAGISTAPLSAKGQWIPTGSPKVARYAHTTTLLDDGRVLVVGGLGEAGATGGAELYDPSTGMWRDIGALSAPRRGHTATLLPDGKVLIFGGTDAAGNPPHRAEVFDPATNTWSSFDAPGWTAGPTATLLRTGKVLVVGGWPDGDDAFHLNWLKDYASLFDPATRTWSHTGNLPELRQNPLATLLKDGRVLLTGGYDNDWGCPVYSTQTYDPVTDSWSTGANLPFGWGHTTTLLPDGRVLAVGVADNFDCGSPMTPAVAELYDPATGSWAKGGDSSGYREDFSASLLSDGKVLIAGGRRDETYFDVNAHAFHFADSLDNAEIYDPVTGLWNAAPLLITPRAMHTATVLHDGHVLVVGGCCGGGDVIVAYGPSHNRFLVPPPKPGADLYGTDFPSGSIVPAMTGAWFDPAQKGHGLLVEVLPDAQLLAWWFAFNPAGTEQSWFGGLGTYSGNTATITAVDQTTGGRFIPNFDPGKIVNNVWGTLTLTFSDCDHGKVEFASTLGYGSGSMDLTRLTRPAGVTCP
jgi:hypothetical protein